MKGVALHLLRNQRAIYKLARHDPVLLDGLKAFKQEQASLNFDIFTLDTDFVSTVVDLAHQLLHIVAMEGCHTDE